MTTKLVTLLFARDRDHVVRFIEFMPLDGSGIWQSDLVFSKREMIERINMKVGEIVQRYDDNSQSEPAMLYPFVDGTGTVGFIPSITEPFCRNCDRVRITSDGRLLTCLFENPGYDLKNLLRSGATDRDLEYYILNSLQKNLKG